MERKEVKENVERLEKLLEHKAEAFCKTNENLVISVNVTRFVNKVDDFYSVHFSILDGVMVIGSTEQILLSRWAEPSQIDKFIKQVDDLLEKTSQSKN